MIPTSTADRNGRRIGTAVSSAHRRRHTRRARYRPREAFAAWLLLGPDAVGLPLFLIAPMLLTVAFAFFNVGGFGQYSFAGLSNVRRIAPDPPFWNSAMASTVYAVAFTVLEFAIGFGLTLLAKDAFRGLTIVRTVLFAPYVVSLVVIGVLWKFLLTENTGLAAALPRPFGLQNVSWLGDPRYALGTLVFTSIWVYSGYRMVMFVAGLLDIPDEYYEAAEPDGTTPARPLSCGPVDGTDAAPATCVRVSGSPSRSSPSSRCCGRSSARSAPPPTSSSSPSRDGSPWTTSSR